MTINSQPDVRDTIVEYQRTLELTGVMMNTWGSTAQAEQAMLSLVWEKLSFVPSQELQSILLLDKGINL